MDIMWWTSESGVLRGVCRGARDQRAVLLPPLARPPTRPGDARVGRVRSRAPRALRARGPRARAAQQALERRRRPAEHRCVPAGVLQRERSAPRGVRPLDAAATAG